MLKVIGNKIKKARKDCNLTLKDLEVKTSVNYVTLSRIERGKRDITVLELKKICIATKKNILYFFTEDKEILNKIGFPKFKK